MALAFNYSNTAVETTLADSIASSTTSITVVTTAGFPIGTPYVLALGYGASDEELVKVTSAAGSTLTVERGFGGTSTQSHSLGAKVRHVVNAQDLIDFRQHEADSSGVHGLTGDVVGTSDAQTLTNKTLTAPAVDGGALSGTFTGAPTLSGDVALTGSPVCTVDPVFISSSAGDFAWEMHQAGDTGYRLAISGDGALNWGDGQGTNVVVLGRAADDVLLTEDEFRVTRTTGNGTALSFWVDGEAQPRFSVTADGDMFWSDGTSTPELMLYRASADSLRTLATFIAKVETSGTFTTASGFSLNDANLRKTCGVCTATVYVTVTSEIDTSSEGSPNIVDTTMGTLPSGYRPADDYEAIWSTGFESGSARISPDGTITLRTSDYSTPIPAGSNLRVSGTYVQ